MGGLKSVRNVFACMLVFYILIRNVPCCNGYNYCTDKIQKELCGHEKHVMCRDKTLPKGGVRKVSIPMTTKIKATILDMHNTYRNHIASGGATSENSTDKFPKAARMREVRWDFELAYIAHNHAKQCSNFPDHCHASRRFKQAGQNMGRGGLYGNFTIKRILNSLDAMYYEKDQIVNTTQFPNLITPDSQIIAPRFAVMINERTSFMGCGISLCTETGQKDDDHFFYQLTCNYEYDNVVGVMVYKTANDSASECSHWNTKRSQRFSDLCENNGKIFT